MPADLDLDPMMLHHATRLASGQEPEVSAERFVADARPYDTVSWTGVSGVTQTRDVGRVEAFDMTIQVRDLARCL